MNQKKEMTSIHLFDRIAAILDQARNNIVRRVNSEIVAAYWHIGREIFEALQAGESRAGYGKKLLEKLSKNLQERYGKGYSATNLKYFRSFYLAYPKRLSSISHPTGDPLKSASKGRPAGDLLETGKVSRLSAQRRRTSKRIAAGTKTIGKGDVI